MSKTKAIVGITAVIFGLTALAFGLSALDNKDYQLIPPANAETLKSGDVKYAVGETNGSISYYLETKGQIVEITKSEYENSE